MREVRLNGIHWERRPFVRTLDLGEERVDSDYTYADAD
jgi:hypothetical protein